MEIEVGAEDEVCVHSCVRDSTCVRMNTRMGLGQRECSSPEMTRTSPYTVPATASQLVGFVIRVRDN